jgi:hypothetical protein
MQKIQFSPYRLSKLAYHLIRHQKKLSKHSSIQVPLLELEETSDDSVPYFLYPMLEIVKIFPQQWYIDENGFAIWIHDESKATPSSIMNFFGISLCMFCHLFIPKAQNTAVFGGNKLHEQSSPKEIADNMLALIISLEIQKN